MERQGNGALGPGDRYTGEKGKSTTSRKSSVNTNPKKRQLRKKARPWVWTESGKTCKEGMPSGIGEKNTKQAGTSQGEEEGGERELRGDGNG